MTLVPSTQRHPCLSATARKMTLCRPCPEVVRTPMREARRGRPSTDGTAEGARNGCSVVPSCRAASVVVSTVIHLEEPFKARVVNDPLCRSGRGLRCGTPQALSCPRRSGLLGEDASSTASKPTLILSRGAVVVLVLVRLTGRAPAWVATEPSSEGYSCL